MKTIKQTYSMKATAKAIFDALTNPEVIEVWSGTPAEMNKIEGEKFSLWGGEIHGTNLEFVENKKIVQEWYGGKWDKPSKVTFTLTEENDETTVELLHEDVPDNSHGSIDDGWRTYYLGPMKEMFAGK